jgi:hypothetical protein
MSHGHDPWAMGHGHGPWAMAHGLCPWQWPTGHGHMGHGPWPLPCMAMARSMGQGGVGGEGEGDGDEEGEGKGADPMWSRAMKCVRFLRSRSPVLCLRFASAFVSMARGPLGCVSAWVAVYPFEGPYVGCTYYWNRNTGEVTWERQCVDWGMSWSVEWGRWFFWKPGRLELDSVWDLPDIDSSSSTEQPGSFRP